MPDAFGLRAPNQLIEGTTVPPVSHEQVRRARLRCVEAGQDHAEAREFLEMCGIADVLEVKLDDASARATSRAIRSRRTLHA